MHEIATAAEKWKPIPGFPAYEISSHGRLRRIVKSAKGHMPGIIATHNNNKGYQVVSLFVSGKCSKRLVSRLVCHAFHGDPPSAKHDAAHNDGNPSNNNSANLRWATRKENMADCVSHGTRATGQAHGRSTKPERTPRGNSHGHSKLTQADVAMIRTTDQTRGSGAKLAAWFGVSPATISLVRNRKIWTHI